MLRDLTRYRKNLVQQRAHNICFLQKVLETANLKLSAVASDITGASGRRMLEAIVREEGTPESLAELAKGRMRGKIPALRQALEGRVQPYHRLLIHESLEHIASLAGTIHRVEIAIAEQMEAKQGHDNIVIALALVAHQIVNRGQIGTFRDIDISSWGKEPVSPGSDNPFGLTYRGKTEPNPDPYKDLFAEDQATHSMLAG